MNDDQAFWFKQDPNSPLYSDLIWSRPENKQHAGKLLIVGGSQNSFKEVNEAYSVAIDAGIGVCNLLLPMSLEKLLKKIMPSAQFGPSTISGSFARRSLDLLSEMSYWADGVLIAGDIGKNSETAVMFESFLDKYEDQITYVNDAIDLIIVNPTLALSKPNVNLILTFAQLQKLATSSKFAAAFTSSMDLIRMAQTLHRFTTTHKVSIVTYYSGHVFVAADSKVSTTKMNFGEAWATDLAARSSVWELQNKGKTFEALSSCFLVTD
jgi:hypothetical protein